MKATTQQVKLQAVALLTALYPVMRDLALATNMQQDQKAAGDILAILGGLDAQAALQAKSTSGITVSGESKTASFGTRPDDRRGVNPQKKTVDVTPATNSEQDGENARSLNNVSENPFEVVKKLGTPTSVAAKFNLEQLRAMCVAAGLKTSNKSAQQLAAMLIKAMDSMQELPTLEKKKELTEKQKLKIQIDELVVELDQFAAENELDTDEKKNANPDFVAALNEINLMIAQHDAM